MRHQVRRKRLKSAFCWEIHPSWDLIPRPGVGSFFRSKKLLTSKWSQCDEGFWLKNGSTQIIVLPWDVISFLLRSLSKKNYGAASCESEEEKFLTEKFRQRRERLGRIDANFYSWATILRISISLIIEDAEGFAGELKFYEFMDVPHFYPFLKTGKNENMASFAPCFRGRSMKS